MKNHRPVIVGIFIVVGIAILVVTIFTLGGQKKTFVKSFTISAIFEDVGGLLKGGNVWFSGVKVGIVKEIAFYGNSQVMVTMSIEKDVQAHIHKNAFAKIGSDGLIGNKIILIYGGDSTMPLIQKNDFLSVESALTTDDMLATLQRNNKNLLDITNDFKNISKKIDSGNGTLSALINDPRIPAKINNTIDNLNMTAANFKAVSAASISVISDLSRFSAKINKPGSSLNGIVTDTILYEQMKTSLADLKTAAGEVSKFTGNLARTSEKLGAKDNVTGVLLNDPSAAASVKAALKNLESGSRKLDENLEALQHNFLLRRFFKKKEKAEKLQLSPVRN